MGVIGQADGQASSTGTRGGSYWSVDTLSDNLVGVLNIAPSSDGTAPERLKLVAIKIFSYLWSCHPWNWRRVLWDMATTVGAGTVALPADFDRFDVLALPERAENGGIALTTNIADFQAERMAWMNDDGTLDTGTPYIGFIEVIPAADGATEYRRRLRIVPAADAVYTYPTYYYSMVPDLARSDVPVWPPFMFVIWEDLTQAIAEKTFGKDEKWKSSYSFAKSELEAAIAENDKDLETQTPDCSIGLDDWAASMGGSF
jgi:hypothetical protein